MLRLMSLPNPRLAQAYIDYMATQHITVSMQPEADRYALYLHDEQHLDIAQQTLADFLQNPTADQYQDASWQRADTRLATQFNYGHFSYLQALKVGAGPFTLTVMAICVMVYLVGMFFGNNILFSWLGFPQNSAQSWQLWRLFTHTFLHFSILHISFNLLWWWDLGGPLEKKLGSPKLIQLFLFSALFSGIGQAWVSGIYFGGLSGIVYALVGYLLISGERAPERGVAIPRPLAAFMLIWLVFGWFDLFGLSIANTAHLIGLMTGALLAWWDTRNTPSVTQH
ncbi:MAG: rhomboid family intramembrane serine protease GlpG [Plesiomonas sp.]|uniref:rhomboid family intramembrane serine protease GlpG n=1 Tax=Plesiomonas sp. TaxID=2486279 RepID=UPI003F413FC6